MRKKKIRIDGAVSRCKVKPNAAKILLLLPEEPIGWLGNLSYFPHAASLERDATAALVRDVMSVADDHKVGSFRLVIEVPLPNYRGSSSSLSLIVVQRDYKIR